MFKPDLNQPVGNIRQKRFGLSVAQTQWLCDSQAGEQLRLREILATEMAVMVRQNTSTQFMGPTQQFQRRS